MGHVFKEDEESTGTFLLLLKTQVCVTEAVSVTGWRCTESKPELKTVNK